MLLSCFLSLLNSDVSVQSSLLNSDVSVYRLLSCFLSLLNGDVCVCTETVVLFPVSTER